MFTRRRALDKRKHYTREFLERFAQLLSDAGFDQLTVMLPHNYASVDPSNSEVPFADFLSMERNFAAIIFKAASGVKSEQFKVLFVNSNSRAVFADNTFPAAESEPAGVYFESPDPGRAYSVFEYFYEILASPPVWTFWWRGLWSIISTFIIAGESVAVLGLKNGLLATTLAWHPLIDAVVFVVALVVIYRFSSTPTGLWIKPTRDTRILYLVNMAIKGELKDNPIVQVVITVVGGLIVALLLKLLGLL